MHGEFVADGPEPDRLRQFIPRLHEQAFEAALPDAYRGRSAELVDTWRRARMSALSPYPETREVLSELGSRVPLALVTNGAARLQRAKLTQTGIDDRFDVIVDSETVGIGKPSPEMFELALRQLGVTGDEVAMVGNDLGRDVAGARAAGVRPIWVHRPGRRMGWRGSGRRRADRRPARAADALTIAPLVRLMPGPERRRRVFKIRVAQRRHPAQQRRQRRGCGQPRR